MTRNCHSIEQRLNALLDERRPIASDDLLAEHVRHCRKCRQLAKSYEALLAAVATPASPPQLAATFAHETVARARLAARRREALPTRRWAIRPMQPIWGAALAATVVLLLIPAVQIHKPETSEPAPVWATASAPAAIVDVLDVALVHRPEEISHAQLWQATGRNLAEIPVTFRRVADGHEQLDLADTLRPVASRLGATLEVLSRLLSSGPSRSEMLNGGAGASDLVPTMRIA